MWIVNGGNETPLNTRALGWGGGRISVERGLTSQDSHQALVALPLCSRPARDHGHSMDDSVVDSTVGAAVAYATGAAESGVVVAGSPRSAQEAVGDRSSTGACTAVETSAVCVTVEPDDAALVLEVSDRAVTSLPGPFSPSAGVTALPSASIIQRAYSAHVDFIAPGAAVDQLLMVRTESRSCMLCRVCTSPYLTVVRARVCVF